MSYSLLHLFLLVAVTVNVEISITLSNKNQNDDDDSLFGTFAELRCNSSCFVDKSLLIKEILEHPKRIVWIIRARKWGKTLNLNMLKTFLQLEVDQRGNELQEQRKTNRPLFVGGFSSHCGRNLTPTKISQHEETMNKYMGKHPVIHLNLRSARVSGGQTYESMEFWLNGVIKKIYSHDYGYVETYIGNRSIVRIENEKLLKKIYSAERLDEDELRASLQVLGEILFNLYNRKSYLLLDEYDAPFACIYRYGLNKEDYLKFQQLVTGTLCNLITTGNYSYYEGGLVTGIIPLKDTSSRGVMVFHDEVYSILEEKFSTYYGFLETEVQQLIKQTTNKSSDTYRYMLEDIGRWYDGYRTPASIYNPVSVIRCLQNDAKLGEYWTKTSELDFFETRLSLSLFCQLQNLVYGGINARVYITPIKRISIEKLNTTFGLLTYLLYGGYLNATKENATTTASTGTYRVAVPNIEIRKFLATMLIKWQSIFLNIEPQYLIDHGEKDSLLDLLMLDQNEFEKKLDAALKDARFNATAVSKKFYVALLSALLKTEEYSTVALHEYEHPNSVPDLVIVPHKNRGIITAAIVEVETRRLATKPKASETLKRIKFTPYDRQLLLDNPHVDRLLKVVVMFDSSNFTSQFKIILA